MLGALARQRGSVAKAAAWRSLQARIEYFTADDLQLFPWLTRTLAGLGAVADLGTGIGSLAKPVKPVWATVTGRCVPDWPGAGRSQAPSCSSRRGP